LVDLVKEFVSKMGEKIKAMEAEMSSLNAEFKSFKKEPAAKKIGDGKTDFNKEVEDALSARINALKSLKNK
jgi:hypothetical protein